ncbi:hypothetical protein TNCV_4162271 [Trichonephila clavipes]|nr:hypothetical protein TNCV_4162271 [Trichonephila clavipes]
MNHWAKIICRKASVLIACYQSLQALRNSNAIEDITPYTRDGEPMARDTIFWARYRSKWFTFSARISQFKELSEIGKFIMRPVCDVTSFDKLNLFQFDWLKIEEFEILLCVCV